MTEEFVLTPGGIRLKSLVHKIEPGTILDGSDGRHRMLDPSGRVLADFGVIPDRPTGRSLMPENVVHPAGGVPAFGSGWITYASWTNNTGTPVSLFSTSWVVPPAPATQSGQVIFLFSGIQNSTMIYQPVLQWGGSAAGGGNYWAVASWYADGQGGQSFYSQLVQVNPGDVLIGVIALTGQSSSAFSYNCYFQGIPNTGLPIQNVQELTWCIETLERYGITQCSDYPATPKTQMSSIDLATGSTNPAVTWSANDGVTDCGQHTFIFDTGSSGTGEVDLWYSPSGNVWSVWRNPDGSWSDVTIFEGVALNGNPIAAQLPGTDVLQLFYRGADNALWSRWRNPDPSWSNEQSLGGVLNGNPTAAVLPGTNTLQLFYRGADNGVYSRWQTSDGWSNEQSLGGILNGDPIPAQLPGTNTLQLFYRGADNGVYSRWQTSDGWSSEQSLGGVLNGNPIAAQLPGRNVLDLFYRGADNAVWLRDWENGSWSNELRLGGVLNGDPIAAQLPGTNTLALFYRGADNAVWARYWTDGAWSDEQSLGGVLNGNPFAAQLPGTNTLALFYRGADNGVYSRWLSDGSWSNEVSLGGVADGDPIAAQVPGTNVLQLFYWGPP